MRPDMGTNYYLHVGCCEKCGRGEDKLHIGKSSAGWCFSLHVDEDGGIKSLADWERLWSQPGTRIMDEYGDVIPVEQMRRTILERKWAGPDGLRRHPVDGQHCVGAGDGTYDLITGWFS
jgi:hypothetical protein